MQSSKIIEVDGVFIGAAVFLGGRLGWRFVAADTRALHADGLTAPTLHDAEMLARRAFVLSRLHVTAAVQRAMAPLGFSTVPPAHNGK